LRDTFQSTCCRETVRRALHRLKLSWKKARKLLSRASREQRQAFVARIEKRLVAATEEKELLVYIDEAHVHQEADLGYGWAHVGKRFFVSTNSPGLWARTSFYGVYLYNEGQVRILPFERANKENTVEVLRWLRKQYPERKLVVVWDGAGYHKAGLVQEEAKQLGIELEALPGYSPDFMPVEALWRWLREEVTYNHCHTSKAELLMRVAAFEQRINQDPFEIADRLWVKDHLDPEEEDLRFSR
jgi:transposase